METITTGHKIFAIIFVILFVVGMIWAYWSDFKKRKEDFKGTWVSFAIIIGVLIVFLMIRYVFKQLSA